MSWILISLIDFVTLTRARFKKPVVDSISLDRLHDFTILIPIFGHTRYLKNLDFLKRYAGHVVLCTTSRENEEFNKSIEALAAEYGFRIFRSNIKITSSKQRPNPWKLFTKTLHGKQQPVGDSARDEIIRDSFNVVTTEYCIFLDGDTVSRTPLHRVTALMHQSGLDVASVRVLASRQKTLIEKLQAIEYEFAMDARRIYPWLTSGACMITKTEVIQDIMNHHSLFFSGGDIEVGKLARLLRYKVGHLAIEFYTDVPETFFAWFKQRMAWAGGGFRHCIINFNRYSWRHPLYFLYFTVIVYGMVVVRWYELVHFPLMLPWVIMTYWLLLFTFQWHNRTWLFFLFPIYALIQIMLVVPLGVVRYLHMAYHSKNIGIIHLRPPIQPQLPQLQPQPKVQPQWTFSNAERLGGSTQEA